MEKGQKFVPAQPAQKGQSALNTGPHEGSVQPPVATLA